MAKIITTPLESAIETLRCALEEWHDQDEPEQYFVNPCLSGDEAKALYLELTGKPYEHA